jgi:hypothetical protein
MRLRCATCAIARPDAELISPIRHATLSRSTSRSALVDAVCGLTLSSAMRSILRPMTPPAALISSTARFTPHHRVFPERAQETRARRQVAEAHRVRLSAADGRKSEHAKRGGSSASLDDSATMTADRVLHGTLLSVMEYAAS